MDRIVRHSHPHPVPLEPLAADSSVDHFATQLRRISNIDVSVATPTAPASIGTPLRYAGIYRQDRQIVYRYDTRPPECILKQGFAGTISSNHILSSFDQQTVFTANSKQACCLMRESAIAAGIGDKFYLYEITAYGLNSFGIEENYRQDPIGLNQFIVDKQLHDRHAEFSQMRRYHHLGATGFKAYLAEKIARSQPLIELIKVEEVHLEGPVTPDRIHFIAE